MRVCVCVIALKKLRTYVCTVGRDHTVWFSTYKSSKKKKDVPQTKKERDRDNIPAEDQLLDRSREGERKRKSEGERGDKEGREAITK